MINDEKSEVYMDINFNISFLSQLRKYLKYFLFNQIYYIKKKL